MRKLLKLFGLPTAHKSGRVRRVFKRNGMAMRGQLLKMNEMNQGFISVSAMRG